MNEQTSKTIEGEPVGNQVEVLAPDDAGGGKNKLSKIEALRQAFERMGEQFKLALPAHIPVERFVRVTMTALQSNPSLLDCDRRSLFAAAMKCAQDGLLPDGRLAAFVPFKGVVQYMPMVAGILKKVRNSGELISIAAHIAYENDRFLYRLGDEERIEHDPLLDGDRGKPKLVYAVAHTKDGGVYRELMTVAEVEKVRAVSRAANNGPWVTWWDEMARKTVIRRLSKYLPMSTDLDDLIRRDDDLYDFAGARNAAETVTTSKAEATRQTLDSFAGTAPKASGTKAKPADHDQETGEVADDKADKAATTATVSPQPDAGRETTAPHAADQAASETREKPAGAGTQEGPEAAAAGRRAEASKDDTPKGPPTNEAEYVSYASAWIGVLMNADEGEKQWKSEKALRNKANVSGDARDDLQEKLNAKLAELRGKKG